MAVKTYQPRIDVRLVKNIRRREVGGNVRVVPPESIDLTPYIGDGCTVSTQKSVYGAMGGFAIDIADKGVPDFLDTVASLADPMDHVTIRMARGPGDPTVVMRGFVSHVRRVEVMSSDGRPQRKVIIHGNDYGRLFRNAQVFYRPKYIAGEALLTTLKFYEIFGQASPLSCQQFAEAIVGIVNDYVAGIYELAAETSQPGDQEPAVLPLQTDITALGTVNMLGPVQSFQGPIWYLLDHHADRAFNEMYVEDRSDGVFFVWRPHPFKDLDDNWIAQGDAVVGTETLDLDIADVVGLDSERTDDHLSNFWWAVIPLSMQVFNNTQIMAAALNGEDGTVYQADYFNNLPDLYGDRQLEATIQLAPPGFAYTVPGHHPEPIQRKVDGDFFEYAREKRVILRELNQDNGILENGSMTLKGDPEIRPGRYLRLTRGSLTTEYYAHSVSHTFRPYQSYLTHIQFSRGTGYIKRSRSTGAPYYDEGRQGPYDQR